MAGERRTEVLPVQSPESEYEATRAEKLRRIEALGVDPWGGRFDGHMPIQTILGLPGDVPDDQRPRVKAGGQGPLPRSVGLVRPTDEASDEGRRRQPRDAGVSRLVEPHPGDDRPKAG